MFYLMLLLERIQVMPKHQAHAVKLACVQLALESIKFTLVVQESVVLARYSLHTAVGLISRFMHRF